MKYIGNKNIPGVLELLVNNLPKSQRYFSLFFGSGGFETSKYTDDAYFICSDKNKDCKKYESNTAVLEYFDYQYLIDDFVFTADDFVFADPPYTFSSRRSCRKYYKYEFDDNDHLKFLNSMRCLNAKIMITHPKCKKYNDILKNWIKIPFEYQTRKGIFKDCLWMNYRTSDIELLNYDALGKNFIDRQAIKRQRKNIINKFENMDIHIRRKIFKDLEYLINN